MKIGEKNVIEVVIPDVVSEDLSSATLKNIAVNFDDKLRKFAIFEESTKTISFLGRKAKETGIFNAVINLVNIHNEAYSFSILVTVLPCDKNCD